MVAFARAHSRAPIRVLIADAYPVTRTGLIMTVEKEPQMQVVGIASHRHDLIPQLRAASVHVLVINLVGMGGAHVALMGEIKRAHPRLGVVVFAATVAFAPELLAAGVRAYVSYAEPDEHLHLAIRAAKARQTYLSPTVQDYVDRYTILAARHRLAPREIQIIKCIAEGLDTSAIANYMDMSYGTVKNYIWSIRNKTGWTTWPQMVSWYHTTYGSEGGPSSPSPSQA